MLERFDRHEKKGIFYRAPMNWPDIFSLSLKMSKSHTPTTGVRALDIMHVAVALSMQADRFFTFDKQQSQLAATAGFQIVNAITPAPTT